MIHHVSVFRNGHWASCRDCAARTEAEEHAADLVRRRGGETLTVRIDAYQTPGCRWCQRGRSRDE